MGTHDIKMQTLMFIKSLHITVLSSVSGHQNSDFIYGSLVYPFGYFDSYDMYEIVLAWMCLHHTTKRPLGRNGSTFLQYNHIPNGYIPCWVMPLIVLVYT